MLRIITLTDRRPIQIDTDEWPEIAKASYVEESADPVKSWNGTLRVRQHDDGRTIVYGRAWHKSQVANEAGYSYAHGELLSADEDSEYAVMRVHESIAKEVGYGHACSAWAKLLEDVILELPPEVI